MVRNENFTGDQVLKICVRKLQETKAGNEIELSTIQEDLPIADTVWFKGKGQ